jgi:hypothetical protein
MPGLFIELLSLYRTWNSSVYHDGVIQRHQCRGAAPFGPVLRVVLAVGQTRSQQA